MNCTPKVRHKTFGVQFIAGVGDFFCFLHFFCLPVDTQNHASPAV